MTFFSALAHGGPLVQASRFPTESMLTYQIAHGEGNSLARDRIVSEYRTARAQRLVSTRVTSRNLLERLSPTKAEAAKNA